MALAETSPRIPLWPLLVSGAAAALALCAALWLTRPGEDAAWQESVRLACTPERVAESFVDAYRVRAFGRAARLATGPLAAALQRRKDGLTREPEDGRRFVLQESHWLPDGRLRLVGALLRNDEEEAAAPTLDVSLTRRGTRWLVDDVEGTEYLLPRQAVIP